MNIKCLQHLNLCDPTGLTVIWPSLNQRFLLNEVHLYLSALPLHENNQVSIPLSSIVKIEIYDKDKGATTGSYILGSVGIAAGVLLVLSVVAVSILISGLAGSV